MAEVVGFESITTGDFILGSHDISEDPTFDSFSDWKAKIVEVRALDEEHVHVRISRLNRPEDLKGGRQDYHGRNELSNKPDGCDQCPSCKWYLRTDTL